MKKYDKQILISVDPGYDGTKVTVNGERFDFPKETVKKVGNEYEQLTTLDGIYEIEIDGETYLCGPNIKVLVDENRDFHERFGKTAEQDSNFSYFATKEFIANCMTAISIALIKAADKGICSIKKAGDAYSLNVDSDNLYLVIELPHESMGRMTASVVNELVGAHTLKLKANVIDGNKDYNVTFEIGAKKLLVMSQVIAALVGYMTDEEGNEIGALQDLYPTLVIDGGYYTVGDFSISKTQAILNAASKTDFGMLEIHERTAARINEKCGTKYQGYDMDHLFEEEEGIVVIPKSVSKSGKNESVDVNPILEEETEKLFAEYLKYLEEKHNYFTKMKQILFAGGTGEIYFNLFKKYAKDYPNLTSKLITYDLDDSTVTPREAISAGGYKMLANKVIGR